MRKILIIFVFFFVLLCGCTKSSSGSIDELCDYSWSKTLDGGAKIRLSFEGDDACLTVDSAGESIEIAGRCVVDESNIVIFVPSLSLNYGFEYLPLGDELELSYEGDTITLEKEK